MNARLSFELNDGEFEDSIRQLRRFERTRFYGALGLIAVIGLAASLLYTKIPSAIAALTMVVLSVLCYRSLRIARLAQRSGRRLAGRVEVMLTDDALVLIAGGRTEKVNWLDVLHCTKTREAWLFVRKRDGAAYLVPEYALAPRDAEELSTFLFGWTKRRYRRILVAAGPLAAPSA